MGGSDNDSAILNSRGSLELPRQPCILASRVSWRRNTAASLLRTAVLSRCVLISLTAAIVGAVGLYSQQFGKSLDTCNPALGTQDFQSPTPQLLFALEWDGVWGWLQVDCSTENLNGVIAWMLSLKDRLMFTRDMAAGGEIQVINMLSS